MFDLLNEEGDTMRQSARRGARDRSMLSGIRSAAILTAKFALIGVSFWYFSENASWTAFAEAAKTVRIPRAAFALVLLALQILLIGLRWAEIVGVLAPAVAARRATRSRMLAITSAGIFFGQIAPNVFGKTVRVWMLAGLGMDWRRGLASVLIDRAVGFAMWRSHSPPSSFPLS
jgi:hypothetical protein